MSDLISRQAAMNHIENEYRKWGDEYDAMQILGDLEDFPSAQPDIARDIATIIENEKDMRVMLAQQEQRWIPVSERLPEKEGWYITTVESEKTGKRRIENDLFAIGIAEAHGHTPNKFCKDGYRQRTVAWMPFPEPYKGE